eukprot:scaffold15493_cov51-Cyclotella_meneghiniana.AAC.6
MIYLLTKTFNECVACAHHIEVAELRDNRGSHPLLLRSHGWLALRSNHTDRKPRAILTLLGPQKGYQ